jgi:hypothetical protein
MVKVTNKQLRDNLITFENDLEDLMKTDSRVTATQIDGLDSRLIAIDKKLDNIEIIVNRINLRLLEDVAKIFGWMDKNIHNKELKKEIEQMKQEFIVKRHPSEVYIKPKLRHYYKGKKIKEK